MFIVVYEMHAHPGQEEAFEAAWAEVTDAIYERQGSLGSRLHRGQGEGLYIAYAQWPSPEAFQNNDPERYDDSQRAAIARMQETIKHADILHMLTVADDRLHQSPAKT